MESSRLLLFLCAVVLNVDKFAKGLYKAGVVEYYYDMDAKLDAKQIFFNNLKDYVNIIDDFGKNYEPNKTGILVFPECGLSSTTKNKMYTTQVPDPDYQNNTFNNEALKTLSEEAKKNNIWIVVNLVEESEDKLYNTDVVFRSNGTIAAKYRKFNLYGEDVSKPTTADIVSFETDFNVTFGIFTCFDIMYSKPALELVENGIKNFIFPTAWFSELPFLSAIQFQWSWSQANDATLLASGLSFPKVGHTGSGIFSKKNNILDVCQTMSTSKSRVIKAVLQSESTDDLAAVTKINDEQKLMPEEIIVESGANEVTGNNDVFTLKQDNLKVYRSHLITPGECHLTEEIAPGKTVNCITKLQKRLCHNDLCCHFNVETNFQLYVCTNDKCLDAQEKMPKEYALDDFSLSVHRMVVFDGVRSFDVTTGGLQTCGVVFCRNEDISSCGLTPHVAAPICFKLGHSHNACILRRQLKYVKIDGKFSTNNTLITPNVLFGKIHHGLKDKSEFGNVSFDPHWINDEGDCSLSVTAEHPNTPLGTLAIWSRVFDRDGQPATNSSPQFSPLSIFLLSSLLIYPLVKVFKFSLF